MSSCYSSSAASSTSRNGSVSTPETPSDYQQKTTEFRTAPASPPISHRSSPSNSLDAQILTHKLQLYQLEEEATKLRLEARRRMEDKQAADVAAAARFRDQLERSARLGRSTSAGKTKKRSTSVGGHNETFNFALGRSSSLKMIRTRKPHPLQLSPTTVQPQEVQSAALPSVRPVTATNEMKKHWRRTTISAPRDDAGNVVLLTSPGHSTEYDYHASEPPPVPQLSESLVSSPQIASPITPMHVEDQIRRQLETFALEEGPNLHPRRTGHFSTIHRPLAMYIPDPDDIMTEKALPTPPRETVKMVNEETHQQPPSPAWRKGIANMFDRRNEVDVVLDMYYTIPRHEINSLQKKPSKSRRQTLLRRFQSIDHRDGKS